jgi:HlyD family secretion protein
LVVVAGVTVFWYLRDRSISDVDILRVSGNIEVTDAEVSFKIPGRVEERLVSEGDTVSANQIVARLDSTELAQEVALRKAEVQAAQAELAELEAGSRPEEIAQAEAVVVRAKADEERLKADFLRQKTLYKREVISAREYDAAKSVYEMSEARLREASEQLALFKKGPRTEKIQRARARLQQTREALALTETRLSYAILVAPLSGVVLSDNVEPGEYVAPGTPVITVGDLKNVWLRAYINETDLGRVKVGQQVRVTTDTYQGKIYEGHISFISSEAEFTPKNVQTEKERVKLVYRAKVDIPNPTMELKPGMPADAAILVGQAQ